MHYKNITRRTFLRTTAAGVLASALPGCTSRTLTRPNTPAVSFGICADVHKDLVPDADQHLAEFITEANKRNVDFVIQLGDFCRPYDKNKKFLDIYHSFQGPAYHVLGNHDTDGGFTREQTLAFWNSPAKYYSFDCNGVHFVVLDGNDIKPNRAPGYPRYIGPEQQDWLARDLAATNLPTITFSHQSLNASDDHIENAAELRAILELANKPKRKILASFNGHEHADYVETINGIHYVNINSTSYQWLGGSYQAKRFSPEIEKEYPYISYTAPYRESIYAFVTIHPDHSIRIEGKTTEFIPPTPADLNHPNANTKRSTPKISNRTLT
ncbi:phosphodiesterase, family [Anaerohalosphaera lusitana]|uniref:Phosphodiesterase, family n=1 Tax=Anaerohalosphaera lusitana TaxID=1936003 RepID=A0A1U9NGV3_9BACT|nr:metallophosphoesterase [Anaerohalosphaera lusitana]AQT67163.1 phosphodiesterase, family [Anaerohalosphaera lusitana]